MQGSELEDVALVSNLECVWVVKQEDRYTEEISSVPGSSREEVRVVLEEVKMINAQACQVQHLAGKQAVVGHFGPASRPLLVHCKWPATRPLNDSHACLQNAKLLSANGGGPKLCALSDLPTSHDGLEGRDGRDTAEPERRLCTRQSDDCSAHASDIIL